MRPHRLDRSFASVIAITCGIIAPAVGVEHPRTALRRGNPAASLPQEPAAAEGANCNYHIASGSDEHVYDGDPDGNDVFWMNGFAAFGGCEVITHVNVIFGPGVAGLDARLFIYEDPNNDGLPDDAVLRMGPLEVPVGNSGEPFFNVYPVPHTLVYDRFFIGVAVDAGGAPGALPAVGESDSPHMDSSWIAMGLTNPDDPLDDPGFLDLLDHFLFGVDWFISAFGTAAAEGPCEYQLDDGTSETALSLNDGEDFFWANAFHASGGCEVIHTVCVQFGPGVAGMDARLFLYDDPNDDGNPDDAVLLAGPVTVDVANSGQPVFNEYGFPETAVAGIFFVGAALDAGGVSSALPAAVDETSSMAASWYALGIDPDDPLSAPTWLQTLDIELPGGGNWLLRAVGSTEDNGACPGDTNGDAIVNVDDLVNVILCWGGDGADCPEPGASADLSQDGDGFGVVNVDDLVAVILAYGTFCFDICSDAALVPAGFGDEVSGCTPVETLLDAGPDLGGPAFACASGAVTQAWVTHQASCDGTLFIDTNGSAIDTVLEVWQGCPERGGTVVACDDDSGADDADSALSLAVSAGELYWIRVGRDPASPKGAANLRLCCQTDAPVNDLCMDAITLAPPPGGVETALGSTSAAGTDAEPTPCPVLITNQAPGVWYRVAGTGRRMTASLCTGTDYDSVLQVFCNTCSELHCVGGDDDGCGTTSGPSTVTWCTSSGEEYLILVQGAGGATGEYTLSLSQESGLCAPADSCVLITPPANDNCIDATPIGDGIHAFTSEFASTDGPYHAKCSAFGRGSMQHDIWFLYTAGCGETSEVPGLLLVSTCDLKGGYADFDTVIAVYDASLVSGDVCDDLSGALIGCNDDAVCFDPLSTVIVEVVEGQQYLIRVCGFDVGDNGTGELLVECVEFE